MFDNSRLDQSQQSNLSTYFLLSTDWICLGIWFFVFIVVVVVVVAVFVVIWDSYKDFQHDIK